MNIYKRKKFYLITLLLMAISWSCDNAERFTIQGSVKNAKGKMLYLSNIGVQETALIDSVRLDEKGEFTFSLPRNEYFEFYRLKLEGESRQITICIDSTETIGINSQYGRFASEYEVTGSDENIKIKELSLLEESLQRQIEELLKSNSPAIGETQQNIERIMDEFKKNICSEYISPAPYSPSAYFSLFLNVNGVYIFNPLQNRFDSKCFAAVATSLDNKYPHSPRTNHLYRVAKKGMLDTRPARKDTIDLSSTRVVTTGILDINLPNIDGDSISLTSLAGKVVMLDFTLYKDTQMGVRNLKLRELYDKYRKNGFEIYQISHDEDEHFWKTSAENLPWICVRDAAVSEAAHLTLYRIEKLPTFFLINRNNELVLRDVQITNLEKNIEELLAQ